MKERRPARRRALRLAQAVVAQAPRSLRFQLAAADAPDLALITGGNRGIGAAVTEALAAAGTGVVVAARQVTEDIALPPIAPGTTRSLRVDLGDLADVAAASERLVAALGGRTLDLLVLNAGVAPTAIERSAQGHELAFAVNVLGHHLLFERLRLGGALAPGARVVVVTGDIFMIARSCSPDFASDHPRAGGMAYARSKLGSVWLATELARRHPDLHIVAVHPGVVRSGLGGALTHRGWQRLTHISPRRSSQAVLAAACSAEVPTGAYVHNTLGLVRLHSQEPAADAARAAELVQLLDQLSAPWRPTASGG